MSANYDKVVHLSFIRDEIKNAAENSLSCKKWVLTLLSAMIVVCSTEKIPSGNNIMLTLASTMFIMICSFWYLDAEYERRRMKLEKLYDYVCIEDDSSLLYDISTEKFRDKVSGEIPIMLSFRNSVIYIPLLVLVYSVIKYLE